MGTIKALSLFSGIGGLDIAAERVGINIVAMCEINEFCCDILYKRWMPHKNVKIFKKLNFGFADLVVAIPKDWLDVQNMADLEEVSFEFREKYGRRMRVATKYPNLTE